MVGFGLGYQPLEPGHAFIGLGEKAAATVLAGAYPLYVKAVHCTHPLATFNAQPPQTIQVPERSLPGALTKAFDDP
ncbi:MAG TPA: hypothetical protein VHN20_02380, partial [Beijerinckiaceae bacterium]|nr:hypothetical protein [Beijerinckiaceae bacterium]